MSGPQDRGRSVGADPSVRPTAPPDLEIALAAAAAGARELAARYRSAGVRETATSKGLRRDLVTDADRAAEAAVLEHLRRACPRDAIIAEETAAGAAPGQRTWIVDPL